MKRSRPRPGVLILLAVLSAAFLKAFVVDLAVVEGRSMLPALRQGDLVLVLRCAYGLRLPRRGGEGSYLLRWARPSPGEIVAAASPRDGLAVVKRVAAVGPAALLVEEGRLRGAGLDLPLVSAMAESLGPGLYLGRGSVFLLGDNAPESVDSRDYGAVPVESIAGRVLFWI